MQALHCPSPSTWRAHCSFERCSHCLEKEENTAPTFPPSAVVPDGDVVAFMRSIPLRKVPSLRGKLGEEVERALGVRLVGDLTAFSPAELAARFGEARGAFLTALPSAQVRPAGAAAGWLAGHWVNGCKRTHFKFW